MLRAVHLGDSDDLCSTSTSMSSLGAVSAQSSVLSFASGVGQSKTSSPFTSVLTLGPLDPSVIKAQTTIVVMPGRAPLLGENAPLGPPPPSRLPRPSGSFNQAGHLRAPADKPPAAKPVIMLPPPINEGWATIGPSHSTTPPRTPNSMYLSGAN